MENTNVVFEMLDKKTKAAEQAKRLEQIKSNNEKELKNFLSNFSFTEAGKTELTDIVGQVHSRIFNIKGILQSELNDTAKELKANEKSEELPFKEYKKGSTMAIFVKSSFSVLYVSSQELENQILKHREQQNKEQLDKEAAEKAAKMALEKREANAKREFWLARRLGTKVPKRFLEFQEEYFIPLMKTYFNGSAAFVARLAELRADAHWYGKAEDDIFAIASHNNKGEKTVTFYIKEIDEKALFADRLVKDAGMDKKLAEKLSNSLPHDQFYVIMEPVKGIDHISEYSGLVAKKLFAREGEIVHDFFQGGLTVFTYGEVTLKNGKKYAPVYVPLRDEPSAILVRNAIYIYLPN